MNKNRRTFVPEVVGTLEDRLVLSAVVPVTVASVERAIESGPGSQLSVVATEAGSDQTKDLSHSGKPGHQQLTFSVRDLNPTVPEGGNLVAVTLKIDYHNESKTSITSATIVDRLGPDFTYVPGNGHTPPGGQLTVTTAADGSQVVNLNLPDGIPRGVEGYLEIDAKYRAS